MYSTTYDMSRGIVSQRPFAHKKHKQSLKRVLNRSGIAIPEFNISEKLRNILSRTVVFVTIIIVWTILLVKNLFFQPGQKITKIKFSEDTLSTYQDIELFNLISEEVKWKNYYMLSSDKSTLLAKIQNKFPFVGAIELQLEPKEEKEIKELDTITIAIQLPLELPIKSYQETQTIFPLKKSIAENENWWTLGVQLLYYEPKILIKLNGKDYAIRDENTYVELKEWMLLWIRDPEEDPLFVIETPMYLTWTNSLDWFFFEISLQKFLEITALAREAFPNMKRFVYLAWSTRIAIFTEDWKTLYFNFPEWWTVQDQRNSQIFKYNTLKERYNKFSSIWTIDLWALEENKTIIKYQ